MLADIHTNDLNLNIDLNEALGEWVDLDKSRVDSTIETTKLGDQTDITLRDRFVWIRTDDTARNSAHSSDTRAQGVDYTNELLPSKTGARLTYSCFHTIHGCLDRFLQREFAHSWAEDLLCEEAAH